MYYPGTAALLPLNINESYRNFFCNPIFTIFENKDQGVTYHSKVDQININYKTESIIKRN